MSKAGTIEKVKWFTKVSCEVTYSSAEEAAAAIEQLQNTTIDGNSRFIDVLAQEDRPKHDNKKRKKGGNADDSGGKGFGKGKGKMQMMMQMMAQWYGYDGYGFDGGAGGGKKRKGNMGGPVPEDPPKSRMCHALALILGHSATKEDMTWTVESVEGKFVGTLECLGQTFTGEPANSKKGAEHAAAEAALEALADKIQAAEEEHKEKKAAKNRESLAKLKAAQEEKKAAKAAAKAAAEEAAPEA